MSFTENSDKTKAQMQAENPKIRTVDNEAYLGMLKELILEGHEVSLLISGSSMAPFLIHHRDSVLLGPVDRALRVGDIVFYQRPDRSYVLHRICRVDAKEERYDLIGDGQTEIEKGVARTQIFARVRQVTRKGKDIRPGSFWWEFFARVWIRIIPFRRCLIRLFHVIGNFVKFPMTI